MSQSNNTVESRRNKHLTLKERYKIEVLLKESLRPLGTDVYGGMVIGIHNRKEDLTVNIIKNKKLTNVRASGSDDSYKIPPHKAFSLEEALEFIGDDELVEVTPDAIRIRKKLLRETDRLRAAKQQD